MKQFIANRKVFPKAFSGEVEIVGGFCIVSSVRV